MNQSTHLQELPSTRANSETRIDISVLAWMIINQVQDHCHHGKLHGSNQVENLKQIMLYAQTLERLTYTKKK